MAGFHVRCRKCEKRRVLRKHPDLYIKSPPQCESPGCDSRSYRVDKHMQERDTRAMGCFCSGYNFGGIMHRRGSKYCWYRKDGTVRVPGDSDFADRDYPLETAA
ncbi:hypothetical protein [Burkholderia cepacia]|uniref:hypothetical protein n=1 Tax=Burkholderia cepacia TaxID=292 RepID=UPI002AB6D966|nr:hypothetical protein [Burkholderia cepacia]